MAVQQQSRLERFLQLAAQDNIRVVNCTTSAQFFHLLRRQIENLFRAAKARRPDLMCKVNPHSPLNYAELFAVRSLEGVSSAVVSGKDGHQELVVISPNPRMLLPHLIRTLMDNGAVLEQIAPTEVTLEDVFVAKTGRTLEEDTRLK